MPDWLVVGVISGVYDDVYYTEVCTLLSGTFLFCVMTLIVISYLVRVLRIGKMSLSLHECLTMTKLSSCSLAAPHPLLSAQCPLTTH